MYAASYLELGQLMWMIHLHINQKSDYDDVWLSMAPSQYQMGYLL